MNNIRNIKRIFAVCNHNLFTINATLDYDRVTKAITMLADLVIEHDSGEKFEDFELEAIGEGGECGIYDLITGAYWHYSEYNGSQSSDTYLAQCRLGEIFQPGMSNGINEDNTGEQFAYDQLAELAEASRCVSPH